MKYKLVQFKTELRVSAVLYSLNLGKERGWNIYLVATVRLLWELFIVLSVLYLLIKLGMGRARAKKEEYDFIPCGFS